MVDNDEDNQEFIRVAFEKAAAEVNFTFCTSVEQAFVYVNGLDSHSFPHLILDGAALLEKTGPGTVYETIPKMVFSASNVSDLGVKAAAASAVFIANPYNMAKMPEIVSLIMAII